MGDTGPGGGTVYYVGTFVQTTTGRTLNYLEVASSNWTGGAEARVAWSGNASSSVSGATGTAIGTGAANTSAIVANSPTANRAATSAQAYAGGGLTDWFLPSREELRALASSGRGGPYNSPCYWTSSQFAATDAYTVTMSGGASPYVAKSTTRWVRPVRAFAPAS